MVKVIHENLGIRHGSTTTIHDLTNTQSILDQPHKDLRRARASSMSLIPTTTGSATAIAEIFPELRGKLNGHAMRVPLANASLTDCVFEVERATNVQEVHALLKSAADAAESIQARALGSFTGTVSISLANETPLRYVIGYSVRAGSDRSGG